MTESILAATQTGASRDAHLIVPSVYSTAGSITFPFSTAFVMLNAARLMVQDSQTDASARCWPGHILQVNDHESTRGLRYEVYALPSTETEAIAARIRCCRLALPFNKAKWFKVQRVLVNLRIVHELPDVRNDNTSFRDKVTRVHIMLEQPMWCTYVPVSASFIHREGYVPIGATGFQRNTSLTKAST